MKELQATIYGKVQGVGFRAYTKKQADKLGLVGWVKNQDDGSVRCIAQGEEADLNDFIDHLETGPYFADAQDIELEVHDQLQDRMSEFKILQ